MSDIGQSIGDNTQKGGAFVRGFTSTVDIESSPLNLAELYQQVLHRTGRIELTGPSGAACVLMTKSELDALESALEILSNSDEVRAMCTHLQRLGALGAPA